MGPRGMASSGMLRCMALVRTDVSDELSASIISMTRICELGTTLAVTSNRRTLRRNTKVRRLLVTANVPSSPILVMLMIEALRFSKTSVLTRATRLNIPEDATLHSHRRENLKPYMGPICWTFCCSQLWYSLPCGHPEESRSRNTTVNTPDVVSVWILWLLEGFGLPGKKISEKNGVFWVVPPCGSCKNRRFGGTWRLLHQGDKNRWTRNNTSCN
jgi:hypothetical protein